MNIFIAVLKLAFSRLKIQLVSCPKNSPCFNGLIFTEYGDALKIQYS